MIVAQQALNEAAISDYPTATVAYWWRHCLKPGGAIVVFERRLLDRLDLARIAPGAETERIDIKGTVSHVKELTERWLSGLSGPWGTYIPRSDANIDCLAIYR